MLQEHSTAVFDAAQSTKNLDTYKTCQVVDTGVNYFPLHYAYAMPKNSPFFSAFSFQIKKLKETAVIRRIFEPFKNQAQVCPDYSGRPLAMHQCITAFGFLLLGVCVSVLWLG